MEHNKQLLEQLIEKCKTGDHRSQHLLYQQYVKPMYNVALRFMDDTSDAEDALQESFIKAFSKLSSFKGESTFGAWLKRIVINQCISELRKRKINARPINETDHQLEEQDTEVWIDPETVLPVVMEAVHSLPDGARIVFILKAIEGYPFNEIAEMIQSSVTNCKVQYHRSKKLLSEKLKSKIYVG